MPSREFLEEMWAQAKKHLPGWLYATLFQSARPAAGGRASHRVDEPDIFAKLALVEINPAKLKDVSDEDLGAIWLRLHQWYANAKRRRAAVENVVNAALWTKAEMERRGKKVGESDLVRAVEELEATAKERRESVHGKPGKLPQFLDGIMKHVPEEVLLVRDWVSVAGSAAVAEKPDDIDVVIRSEYDAKRGSYLIDGASLWVALRRFMSPTKKSGPQIQLLGSPQGSFTDYVPVFDLVVRKRNPHVVKIEPTPPEYEDRERVIKRGVVNKQARAATAEIRARAERAKKSDKLTVGEYFYQPKPTRPAFEEQPMTVDGLIDLYADRKDKWLPTIVQKKLDGANHQGHKDGDKVIIYSEDGDDNTDRLPGIVEAIKALKPERLVLTFEIEKWDGKQHLPRETVAGYLAEKSEPDDGDLVANVYDILWSGDSDLHKLPTHERMKALEEIGIKQSTEGVPDLKERLNHVPYVKVFDVSQLRKVTESTRKLPGSEGIVAKQADAPYRLDHTTQDDWVKFHNAALLRGVVLQANRTKGGAFTYDYGVNPGRDKVHHLEGGGLTRVGESFSTARRFSPGDNILLEVETVNRVIHPTGIELTAWVPRVLGEYDGEPDTVDDVVRRAAENLVLQTKRVDDRGEVVEYLPPNVEKARETPDVPAFGKQNADIAFVGASPGKADAARREPFVGPGGETFNEVYLKPLGLKRSDIVLLNVVPLLLTDEQGRTREPTIEEVKDWHDWSHGKLDELKPKIVVALGRTAESALDDRSDFVLPHPSAVRRFGDSGEVGRKLKQIKTKLEALEKSTVEKQLPEPLIAPREEGGTRSIASFENWEKDWDKLLPTSGKGRSVYQHHWRGLDEDETKYDETALMKTDHSIHGDIRLEGDDGLWGWAVLLGRAEDNKEREQHDKLIGWKDGDNIELAPKLQQPKSWLEVGVGKPHVSGPGEVGATSEKYSKFFALDTGTYQLGVARQHMVEIFLDGKYLKGRYLFTYAPVAGRRRWLIDKPSDQTPMVESRDLADLIGELKRKGQRYLIWSGPGRKPQKIDVRRKEAVRAERVPILKTDTIKRIVYGIVLDPYGKDGPKADAHGDWTPPGDVEKTAHEYMKGARVVGLQHKGKANATVVESWVEQYPSRQDYLKAVRSEPHRVFVRQFGTDVIRSGSWALGVQLGEKEWKLYLDGKLNAFSPGGYGVRTPIDRGKMPEVEFVELVTKEPSRRSA